MNQDCSLLTNVNSVIYSVYIIFLFSRLFQCKLTHIWSLRSSGLILRHSETDLHHWLRGIPALSLCCRGNTAGLQVMCCYIMFLLHITPPKPYFHSSNISHWLNLGVRCSLEFHDQFKRAFLICDPLWKARWLKF